MRDQLNSLLADYHHARRSVREEKAQLQGARAHLHNVLTAQKLAQEVAESVQREAHARIASLVTRCLRAVFEEDAYEFRIDFVRKRGKTEANLILSRDGMDLEDPLNEAGGGVLDIAAFALRLTALLLSMPPKRKVLILDEPWKNLSSEYRPRLVELVKVLSQELKVQFIIVTHFEEYKVGKVVQL